MAKKKKSIPRKGNGQNKRSAGTTVLLNSEEFMEMLRCGEYISLAENPQILAGCKLIADLVSNMTIYLMSNTDKGDVRIKNELSRHVDVFPNRYMTRKTFISSIVMNLLLHGSGNSVVYPTYENKLLGDLHPVSPDRVSFVQDGWGYKIIVDGIQHDPDDFLHFVWNPNKRFPWKGDGITVALKDIAKNLKQAGTTKQGFMESKWKPSIIVKVDAIGDEFSDPEKRGRILDDYVATSRAGEPWILPAEQFEIEQIRPLSLNDLALKDSVELDKKDVASLLGIPAFVLGVGQYNKLEWDNFVNTVVMSICKILEQEMTRKLILSDKWYWKFNVSSLYSYDLKSISEVYLQWFRNGLIIGNEARDKIGLPPMEGLDKLVMLENFIPVDRLGDQKKLKGKTDE